MSLNIDKFFLKKIEMCLYLQKIKLLIILMICNYQSNLNSYPLMTSIRDELNICSVTPQASTSATTPSQSPTQDPVTNTTPSKAPTTDPTSGTSKSSTQTTTTSGGSSCTTVCK